MMYATFGKRDSIYATKSITVNSSSHLVETRGYQLGKYGGSSPKFSRNSAT